MAQFWIAIFFIFLAVAQLYQSIKDINLPLPVYLVLGAMLAVASNSQPQLSFTPARQTTRLEFEKSDPSLSLISVATSPDDLQSIDTTIPPLLLAEHLPPQVELAAEIKPVNSDPSSILLAESLSPLTEILQDDIQLVDPNVFASDILPILLAESLSLPAEIAPEDKLKSVINDAAPVILAAALPSQHGAKLEDDIKSVADDITTVDREVLPITIVEPLPPQTEPVVSEEVKPAPRKTSRKKSTSAKKTRK
jgi:hypothetical protein